MKHGPTTTSQKPRKRVRNGAIPPHQNRKKSTHNHLQGRLCWPSFWDKREVILEYYISRGITVTSTTYADLLKNHLRPAIKTKQRGHLSIGVLLQCDNARSHTARSTVATIQDCPLSVCHIRRTHQTSLPVTFMFLDRAKRRWEASLSGSTKRCSRRCTSGCTLSQKKFFL